MLENKMLNEMSLIIENLFEDNIKNEAMEIVALAFKQHMNENHFKFISNHYHNGDEKSSREISIRIDYIKSLLIKEGLSQKIKEDYFGKIEIIEILEL